MGAVPEVTALSELYPEPFKWRLQEKMPGSFEMVDGVVKYFADAACTHEPFPAPGSSLEFFTDMHRYVRLLQGLPVDAAFILHSFPRMLHGLVPCCADPCLLWCTSDFCAHTLQKHADGRSLSLDRTGQDRTGQDKDKQEWRWQARAWFIALYQMYRPAHDYLRQS